MVSSYFFVAFLLGMLANTGLSFAPSPTTTTTTTTTPSSLLTSSKSFASSQVPQKQKKTPPTTSALNMALVPLSVDDVDDLLVVGAPSGPQYAVYWGRTKRERYNRFLESAIVSCVGLFFSSFLSFVIGGFVSTIIGALFLFWGILSPEFKARQRNWEFLGGRQVVDVWSVDENDDIDNGRYEDEQGLYGSIYLGRVDDVCVVEDTASIDEFDLEDFQDYTMDSDELEQFAGMPYLIRLRVTDESQRELQIHARLSEDYLDIERGMPVAGVVLSTSQSFKSLAALTDIFIPDADAFVGDYPYLDQTEMEALLAEDDELWDLLQSQGDGQFTSNNKNNNNDIDADDDDDRFVSGSDLEMVPIRRRKY